MRDINRIKPILEKIEKIWLANSDWRINQLIHNCGGGFFYTEDDKFEQGLDAMIEQMEKK